MTLNEYQTEARVTAQYPCIGGNIVYPAIGLAGETGEVLDKVKKVFRDKDGILTDRIKREIVEELGDVLWYVANLSFELGYNLEDVATINIVKLSDRYERGTICGEGDNR